MSKPTSGWRGRRPLRRRLARATRDADWYTAPGRPPYRPWKIAR